MAELQRKAGASSSPGDWKQDLLKNPKGKIERCLVNVFDILSHDPRWHGVLALDHAERVLKRSPPPWKDGRVGPWDRWDFSQLEVWFSRHYLFVPTRDMLKQAVELVAHQQRAKDAKP